MSPCDKNYLGSLGIRLPPVPLPAGSYVPCVLSGPLGYVSGQIARRPDGGIITGRVGEKLSLEEGRAAAETAALNALSVMDAAVGLDGVDGIVKVTGYVQTAVDFFSIAEVVNGASDLFVRVFGERGKHARAAVGVWTLPRDSAVEIEVVFRRVCEKL